MSFKHACVLLYAPPPAHRHSSAGTVVIHMTSDSAVHLLMCPATHLESLKQIRWLVVETGEEKERFLDFWYDEQDGRSHAFLLTRLTLLYFYQRLSHPSLLSSLLGAVIVSVLHHWWSHVLCVYHQEGEGDRGREGERALSLSFLVRPQEDTHTHTFTHKHSETYTQPVCSSLRDGHRKHGDTRLCGHRSSEQHYRYRKALSAWIVIFIQQFLPEWQTVICRWTLWEASCFDSTLRFELGCSEAALCLRTRGGGC